MNWFVGRRTSFARLLDGRKEASKKWHRKWKISDAVGPTFKIRGYFPEIKLEARAVRKL
jgi:hypothetical protein